MDVAAATLDAVSEEEDSLVVFPAGFFRAASLDQRDQLAATVLERAREQDVTVVFGIDVQPDGGWKRFPGPADAFAFVCEGGKKRLWPTPRVATPHKAPRLPEGRVLVLGGIRLGLLIESELFSPRLRTGLGRSDLIVVLAHGGMTERWRPALAALDKQGPVLVVGQTVGARAQLDLFAPRGWRHQVASAAAEVTLHRYAREPAERVEAAPTS
jgi:hypothetical protein